MAKKEIAVRKSQRPIRCAFPRRRENRAGSGQPERPYAGLALCRFPRPEARRLVEMFEWRYTPKYGSWLDMAESELAVLTRRRLGRRVPDKQTRLGAPPKKHHAKADWQFTTHHARVKPASQQLITSRSFNILSPCRCSVRRIVPPKGTPMHRADHLLPGPVTPSAPYPVFLARLAALCASSIMMRSQLVPRWRLGFSAFFLRVSMETIVQVELIEHVVVRLDSVPACDGLRLRRDGPTGSRNGSRTPSGTGSASPAW